MLQATQRLSWGLAVCALMLIAGCGGAKSRFASHMQRGEQYLGAGALEKASVEFRNALQIEPHDARGLYLNGRVAERLGNLRGALGSYQAAIDSNPDYPDAQAALGRILVFGGATERALPVIEAGLARHPDNARLLTVRAAARLRSDELGAASADAEHALRIAPDDEDAVALLASAYQHQGETARAIDLVAAALTRHPASIALHQVLASLYLTAHQNDSSETQLEKIVALAPRELTYRYQLARFHEIAGNLDAAQRVLQQAVIAFPESSGARLALVDFLAQHRSSAEAEKVLRGYIAAEPDSEELRLKLGALLQATGSEPQALTTYDDIVTRSPRGAAALVARDRVAAIRLADGQPDAAGRLIDEVLRQNPRDNDALLMRARLALRRANAPAAIADLRSVLRDQPGALGVQRLLARAYLVNGEPALAEETLREAIQRAADSSLQLDLAQLLLQTGRADAAVRVLEEAARQAPDDAAAHEALVRTYLISRDLAAARSAAEALKTLQPDSAVSWYLAGVVAQQQNRPDDARREFERALELKPAAVETLGALARLRLARGEGAQAVARVRAVATEHPQDASLANLLGETLISARAYAAAAEPLSQAIRLAPKWTLPYHNLGAARLASHDAIGALSAFQQGLKEAPYDPLLTSDLAELYETQGRIDDAIGLYEALHAHDPHLELAANNLAMLLVTYRTDRRSLERARELTTAFAASESSTLLDTRGWVALRLGDLAEALPVLQRAADRSPDSKVIHYHLAMAELKAGQRDKALGNLETALSGAARFAGSDEARATLDGLIAGNRG